MAVTAASILAAALALLSALHVYWALGGERWLAAALGRENAEATAGVRVAAAAIAVLLVAAAAGVLARAGVWRAPLPWRVVSVGAWLLAGALALAAVANLTGKTSLERFGFAPLALVLALLAAFVAWSERPE